MDGATGLLDLNEALLGLVLGGADWPAAARLSCRALRHVHDLHTQRLVVTELSHGPARHGTGGVGASGGGGGGSGPGGPGGGGGEADEASGRYEDALRLVGAGPRWIVVVRWRCWRGGPGCQW